MILSVFIVIKVICLIFVKCDNFPSLLTTNITLAIVIDREYLAEQYDPIKDVIENYLVYAKREILKHGGVNVQFFSWTSINVKRDITAILSIASCEDTWKLFKAASDENILHMAISETDCPRMASDEAFAVPIIKLGEELPQIILDLKTTGSFKWTSAVVLYDSTLGRDIVTRVLTALTKVTVALKDNTAVSLIQLQTNSSASNNRQFVKDMLEKISSKTVGNNFLAIVSMDTMEIIMDVAKGLGLATPNTQWLYVISDTNWDHHNISNVKNFLKEGDNVAYVFNTTKIKDLECKGGIDCHAEEILEAFTRGLEIAILSEYELASQVSDEEWEAIRPNKLERRNFLLRSVKSHLLQYGTCDNCTTWKLQAAETWGIEYQKSSKLSSYDLINVGAWRPSDGIAIYDELFPHIAHGFRGRNLPLVTFHNPPWQILKFNDSGLQEYSGIIFDVIKELASNMNFTYTVEVLKIESKFNTTIGISNNSSNTYNVLQMTDIVTNVIPDKIVNMIKSKEVAIGACGLTVTDHGKTILNFTSAISTQTYTILVARPKELSRALLFMSPFTKDTWLCLAAAIVSMGPILYYIHKFSPVYEYKGIGMAGGLSSIQNCIWYMYGALLQQGGMHLPSADSARIIVGSWWLVVLVVATTYCGNLVAFLTFPKIDIPISTIENLLENKGIVTWSIPKGGFLEAQLKTSEEPKYREIYSGSNGLDLDSKEMLKLIEEGKHVYIDWKLRLQYIMRKQYLITDRCDLALGADDIFDEKIALVVAQDLPYIEKINKEIKRLHQVGLIDKWLKDYMPKKDKCFKVRHVAEVNNHTVNMDDMQGSFFVLFFGFILAFALILFEKVWHKYMLKKQKQIVQPYMS